jgi:hypothetical protein
LTTLIFDQLKPGKKYTNEGRRRIFGCHDTVAAVKAASHTGRQVEIDQDGRVSPVLVVRDYTTVVDG